MPFSRSPKAPQRRFKIGTKYKSVQAHLYTHFNTIFRILQDKINKKEITSIKKDIFNQPLSEIALFATASVEMVATAPEMKLSPVAISCAIFAVENTAICKLKSDKSAVESFIL